jgi:hypothetical protein
MKKTSIVFIYTEGSFFCLKKNNSLREEKINITIPIRIKIARILKSELIKSLVSILILFDDRVNLVIEATKKITAAKIPILSTKDIGCTNLEVKKSLRYSKRINAADKTKNS